ncbi:MFS transporter [Arthrobacter sp. SLBN-100]|uniref:MFS transporter n=1 Tax=Arthrobacter sp. SLBN-100 TaxID=2768450 RepID=UPI0011533BC7|nr:MFS transporter [Arthrobacter sp. SLBN-100]TQJ62138.1 MFS transporter [Arthrobacter sp. SLBN-100]
MAIARITRSPWWVGGGSMLALTVAVGPLIMTTMGFFMGPISKDFGWTRGQISAALTTCSIAAAITSPFLGRFIDRIGLRKVVTRLSDGPVGSLKPQDSISGRRK